MNTTTLASFTVRAGFVLAGWVRADETVLYETVSTFGPIIVSEDDKGLRILRFEKGGPRQSHVKRGTPDHLELPYTRVAFAGLALCEEPRRILVVGLGGGALPMFLRKYYPDAVIDAVDIDPAVVDVAKRYFDFREDDRMRAHVDDGRRFIETTAQPYDVIFLDAYGNDHLPAHLTTQEFLRAVRRAVKPDGVVVGNVWGRGYNRLYDSMVRTYQEVFDELFVMEVPGAGNMILFALPRTLPLGRDELAQRARKVSDARHFRFDLGEAVTRGFHHAREKDQNARVLRDADSGQARQR